MRVITVIVMFVLLPLLAQAVPDWTELPVDSGLGGASGVCVADLDGDGDMDVIGAILDTDQVFWWENTDGTGLTLVKHAIATGFDGATDVAAADIDGDGDLDVFGAGNYADDIAWWENLDGEGGSWTEHTISGSFDGAYCVFAADVDLDGDPDVVGAARYADDVAWWENHDGGSNWTRHSLDEMFDGAYSVYSCDLDGDEDMDVIAAARSANTIAWWENDGAENFTEHSIAEDFSGASDVYAADVDGDGDADVLGAARYDDLILWWENTGEGDWAAHQIYDGYDGSTAVAAADLDGDGDTDVLGASYDMDNITWWENLGSGEIWAEHELTRHFNGVRTVIIADLDSDGDADLVGAAANADAIHWWRQSGPIINPPVDLVLTSFESVIPDSGGQLFFRISITNNTGTWQIGHVWTEVLLPSGFTYGPLDLRPISLSEGTITTGILAQVVPFNTPAGTYVFSAKVGAYYQNIVYASDSFSFIKTAEGFEGLSGWTGDALEFTTGEADASNGELPGGFMISPVYPNPFNSSARVRVSMPETADLHVIVFNIAGERVATLSHGPQPAGSHTFNLDASTLASGLYFIRATVPGRLDQVQKVMLVR